MQTRISKLFLLVAAIAGATLGASAQEVVHALTGTVTAINPSSKTITIDTDDGSEGKFTTVLNPGQTFDFPKIVRAETVPAASFSTLSTRVLIYYIGNNSVRTAVAVEDLGAAPLVKTVGSIVKMDRHGHSLTIKDASGVEESFHIDAKTVAEAAEGVEEGTKFDAQKGDRVRVVAANAKTGGTALFIRSL